MKINFPPKKEGFIKTFFKNITLICQLSLKSCNTSELKNG